MDDSPFHIGYISTGFSETEYDVYSENNLLSSIQSAVVDYSASDLTLNSY